MTEALVIVDMRSSEFDVHTVKTATILAEFRERDKPFV